MVKPLPCIGFVLIITKPGSELDVLRDVQNVPFVKYVYPLFGEYDIIAKLECEDIFELGQVIMERIRCISGVTDTKTLTGVKL